MSEKETKKEITIKDIIAKNISCLRKREKMTQADLANRLNYSDKAISKWERGESLPDAEMLYKIAQLFNVKVEFLFKDHEYAGLTNQELEYLKKREKKTKFLFFLSLIAILLTLLGILFSSLAEIFNITDKVRFYLFIVPAIPVLAFIVNTIYGQKKYNMLLESLIIWSASIAFYIFFIEAKLIIIFSIAAILQAALILFPKVTSYFTKVSPDSSSKNKQSSKDKK